MKIKLIVIVVITLTASAILGQTLPKASPIPPPLEAKEIAVPLELARDYQVIDLKHRLALAQFNGKISEFLATPEMLELRQNVLGLDAAMKSKVLIMAEAVQLQPENYSKYRFVPDDSGSGKFERISN